MLGDAYLEELEFEQARQIYESALEVDPGNPVARTVAHYLSSRDVCLRRFFDWNRWLVSIPTLPQPDDESQAGSYREQRQGGP